MGSVLKVDTYELGGVEDGLLAFAVIMARYRGQWIFGRHRDRATWEIPGGHREAGESIEEAARRELYEESGATRYALRALCAYSVDDGAHKSYGQLFLAEVAELAPLPPLEIVEIRLFAEMPSALTYPTIQPLLFSYAADAAKRSVACSS